LIEHLPQVQKLQLLVKVQLFLLKTIIVQASQFNCDSTHLAPVTEQLMLHPTIYHKKNFQLYRS